MASISSPNTIASNCSVLNVESSSISTEINSEYHSNLAPQLYLKFESNFKIKDYDNIFFENLVKHFFEVKYRCGNKIKFINNSLRYFFCRKVIVKNTNGRNRYKNNTIFLRRTLDNPIVLLHEIIHAIIEPLGSHFTTHNLNGDNCGHLDVFTNGAPGFMMDMVTRLQLHFTPSKLGKTTLGVKYLPDSPSILYPDLAQFCYFDSNTSNSKKRKPLNSNLEENPEFIIEERKFLSAKFGHEYEVLKNIPGFPLNKISKPEYIKRNLNSYYNKLN